MRVAVPPFGARAAALVLAVAAIGAHPASGARAAPAADSPPPPRLVLLGTGDGRGWTDPCG